MKIMVNIEKSDPEHPTWEKRSAECVFFQNQIRCFLFWTDFDLTFDVDMTSRAFEILYTKLHLKIPSMRENYATISEKFK